MLRGSAVCLLTVLALLLAAPADKASADGDHGPAASSARKAADKRVTRMRAERRWRAEQVRRFGPAHAAEHVHARAEARKRLARLRAMTPAQRRRLNAQRRRIVARAAVEGPADTVGHWGAGFDIPIVPIHSALLPTGKVLWLDGQNSAARAALWDPATGAVKTIKPPVNLFCSGHVLLPDGRLLVVGGTVAGQTSTSFYKASNKVFLFDPWEEKWIEQPQMARGRWYPSTATFGDGRALILGGSDETGEFVEKNSSFGATTADPHLNPDIEVFTPGSEVGTITKVGHRGGAGEPPNGRWYPHMFLMPSGRMLVTGAEAWDSWLAHPPASGGMAWTDVPNHAGRYQYSTAVPLPGPDGRSNKVMIQGGWGSPAHPNSEVFDDDRPSAGWVPGPSLKVGRMYHNTVLLPDESMVTVGGGNANGPYTTTAAHRQIELYDPGSKTWRLGASQLEDRAYHSTALLLPDGRVLSAGDNDAADHGGTGLTTDRAEVYSPPYLYRGARPTITSAPSAARWGSRFTIRTGGAEATRAVLVAPGAATHSTINGQRVIPLDTTRRADGTGVDVTVPGSVNVAPPGYYMLFVLTPDGVPSVSKWIQLRPDASPTGMEPTPSPDATPTSTPAPTHDSVPAKPSTPKRFDVKVRVHAATRRALSSGVAVDVTCSEGCRASLRLTHNGRTVARGSGRRDRAGTTRMRIRFTRAGAAQLKRRRSARLAVTAIVTGDQGAVHTIRRTIKFG